MDKVKVLMTMPLSVEQLDILRAVSPKLEIVPHVARALDDLGDAAKEAEIIYSWRVLPQPDDAPALRWVQLHMAGVDSIVGHPLFTETDVIFTNASGIHAVPMAEYAIGMVLAFAHRMPRMFEDMGTKRWSSDRWARFVPSELRGAAIGIIGYGSIGREIARLADAFGMRVLASKRDLRALTDRSYVTDGIGDPEADIPDRLYPPEAVPTMVADCDYVVLTAPLTEETRGMIDAAMLSKMKPGAVLINIGRGELVDEDALLAALKSGQLGGAALDVFHKEPLLGDSPLWAAPNVILSPHVSGFTPEYDNRAVEIFAYNLAHYVAGEPLVNVVDRSLGY